jgi:hypothetical protein
MSFRPVSRAVSVILTQVSLHHDLCSGRLLQHKSAGTHRPVFDSRPHTLENTLNHCTFAITRLLAVKNCACAVGGVRAPVVGLIV